MVTREAGSTTVDVEAGVADVGRSKFDKRKSGPSLRDFFGLIILLGEIDLEAVPSSDEAGVVITLETLPINPPIQRLARSTVSPISISTSPSGDVVTESDPTLFVVDVVFDVAVDVDVGEQGVGAEVGVEREADFL
jgi:hypothetical protein